MCHTMATRSACNAVYVSPLRDARSISQLSVFREVTNMRATACASPNTMVSALFAGLQAKFITGRDALGQCWPSNSRTPKKSNTARQSCAQVSAKVEKFSGLEKKNAAVQTFFCLRGCLKNQSVGRKVQTRDQQTNRPRLPGSGCGDRFFCDVISEPGEETTTGAN
jgi:hypothetical protein